MKKFNSVKTILIILCFSISTILAGQPSCQWSKGYGSADPDYGVSTTVDVFGNIYSIGFFKSPTLTLGATTLNNVEPSGNNSDIFIMKSDSCGNVIWAKKAGDEWLDDRGLSITTDKNGNVYAAGAFYSYYIKFGADSLRNDGSGWGGFLVKYNPSGTALWAKALAASGSVFPSKINIDKNGDVVMTGFYYSDSVKFDAIKLTGSSSQDNTFIAKYNSTTGSAIWAKKVEYEDNNSYGIATDTVGNIFIAGSFRDSIKIENIVLQSQANRDVFYAKYNSSGNVIWAKRAGYGYFDEATGIATDKAGNIFIAGHFQSDSISFDNVKLKLLPSTFTGNGFLLKCDGAGTALWAKRIGGLTEDHAQAVTTNAQGDVFVGGHFRSSFINIDGTTLNNSTGTNTTFDFYLAKYTNNGQFKWAKKAGGLDNDYLNEIAIGLNNIPIIIGEYASTSIAFAGNTLTNNGLYDIFLTNDINRIGVPVPQLCEVTVDSISQNNMIYWDKTPYDDVERFIVYREIATNSYKPIASVHVDSLSLFVDTVRTKYFPNTGNPNIGTYRYKIQIQDTAGNFSLLSPYHNTIYMAYNPANGQALWNSYEIEGASNPVSSYVLKRDNDGTGTWAIVGGVTGTQNTVADPAFATYPNGRWRIETQWSISCTPTRGTIVTTRSNIKSSAAPIGIMENPAEQLFIHPNPATESVTIQYHAVNKNCQLQVFDAIGQLVYNETLAAGRHTKQINVSTFKKGFYIISIQSESGNTFKRLTIQ
ncbi:MAG: T9SS type A sorting domain-containing protein [Bacteroidota bacterium]